MGKEIEREMGKVLERAMGKATERAIELAILSAITKFFILSPTTNCWVKSTTELRANQNAKWVVKKKTRNERFITPTAKHNPEDHSKRKVSMVLWKRRVQIDNEST